MSFLADLAGGGAALELGIGTGRIAIPLSGLVCKFVRGGHAARAGSSCSSRRRSSRSKSNRLAYWRQVLAAAEQADPAAPTRQRIGKVEQTIADLRRRLRNQLLGLEDDDLTPQARRHITGRIAELEQAIAEHEGSLVRLHAELDIPTLALDALAGRLLGCRYSGNGCGSCRSGSCDGCSTAWIDDHLRPPPPHRPGEHHPGRRRASSA